MEVLRGHYQGYGWQDLIFLFNDLFKKLTMKIKLYFLIILFTIGLSGCEKYLEENYLSGENSASIISSEETFESLITAGYVSLRAYYGKENAWDLTEAGTDLYTWGLDNRSQGFCTYASFTTSEEQERMKAMWRELYKALNTCNLILDNIDKVPFSLETTRESRRGEISFLRAHYLWLISEIWGEVHFTTTPSEEVSREANKTPIEQFRQQIISDLEVAISSLPIKYDASNYGRITKPAAEAMLSRVYLYMKNYPKASEYAQKVINNYDFALLDDWTKIWNIENLKNEEIIWAVNYSDDPVTTNAGFTDENGNLYNTAGIIQRGGGHTGHVMFEIRYENLGWGMIRDLENGRGFQRWAPTKYFIDLYNEDIDERFNGSFKTVWKANNLAASPKWKPFVFIDGVKNTIERELWAKPILQVGDTSIVFSKKPIPQSKKGKFSANDLFYINPQKGYLMIDINDMYLPDGSLNDNVINRQFYFPITKKYEDPTRIQLSTEFSKRDAIVFRISEMYLIAAEAEMLQGNNENAVSFINTLRMARSIEGKEDEMKIEASDLNIDFILDERGRELATEFQRIFDLKRTGKFLERIKAYNHDAAPNVQDFHSIRFIPQSQIDAMVDGASYQNPGY